MEINPVSPTYKKAANPVEGVTGGVPIRREPSFGGNSKKDRESEPTAEQLIQKELQKNLGKNVDVKA